MTDRERYERWLEGLRPHMRMLVLGTTDPPAYDDMTTKDQRRWRYFKSQGMVPDYDQRESAP